jgi:thiosulfate dehydrogenase
MWKLIAAFVAGAIAVPILVVLTALLGLWPADATSEPPGWETAIASRALEASIEWQAPEAKSPVPADNATILAGIKMYGEACAGCHGLAKLRSVYGLSAYPRVPQFGRQPPDLKDYQAYWVIKNGLRYSGMVGFHGMKTSDEDMWRAAEFVSHLRKLSPEAQTAWKQLKMR